jgi:hypothetical protein
VLIDGDGALFNFELIEQGKAGGGKAAVKIMESIKSSTDSGRRDDIWLYIFLNKKGLKALFQRHNRPMAMDALEDFIIGMNEAAKTIMVVDVGQKKEAADSKIKGAHSRDTFTAVVISIRYSSFRKRGALSGDPQSVFCRCASLSAFLSTQSHQ